MKKLITIIYLIIAFSFVSENVNAQAFKPGIIGGIVTSQLGGDGYSGFNKLGVTFGGFVRYNLSDNWSAQFEISYVQKGSRNNFSISTNDPTQASEYFIFRLNYIEIPLLFKFSYRNFVYEGGLYYARLAGTYFEYRDDFGNSSGPYENLEDFNSALSQRDFSQLLQNWDFGGMLGVGYKITDNVLASLRISNSFVAIKDFESGQKDFYPTSFRIGYTNTVVLGTIRYTFGESDEKHENIQK